MPGLRGVVAITQDGQPVRTTAGGGATPETRFLVASVRKNLAATLVRRLVERSVLDLHAPLTGGEPITAGRSTSAVGAGPGDKSLIAWLPGGRGVVARSDDDATDWDDVLTGLL